MISEILQQQIIKHAQKEYPKECCGLLVSCKSEVLYFPCTNLAKGEEHFILDPRDYALAANRGEVLAVVHSHPDSSPEPSQADKTACEATGVLWYILSYPALKWVLLKPTGFLAPLVGRQWAHGVQDCYTIIRDWYRLERSINLPDFFRADEWWLKGENLYLDNFEKAGFLKMPQKTELQVGDVILMQIHAGVPNHAAIYLGDDIILHHLYNRLSTKDTWGGYWRKHAVAILRYDSTKEDGDIARRAWQEVWG